MATACGAGVSTDGVSTQPQPQDPSLWAAEAVAYKEAAYRAAREGIPNVLPFYTEDFVFEDTTGCRIIYGRHDFVEFSGIVFGESDPSQMVTLMLAADESLDQYRWEDTYIDWLDRVWTGPAGIERTSLAVAIGVARFEQPDARDWDAIEALADRYVTFWNGPAGTDPETLYMSGATIDDTLLGGQIAGTEKIRAAVGSGEWPDTPPLEVTRLPEGPATATTPSIPRERAIYIAPHGCLDPSVPDEIRMVLEANDGTGCPGRMGVVLAWDGERVLWERRYHEVESVRRCRDIDGLEPGWWEGIEIPEIVTRNLTSSHRVTPEMTIDVYNGTMRLVWFTEWGVSRFTEAGLPTPRLGAVTFLRQKTRCDGFAGFAATGDDAGAEIILCHTPDEICLDDRCQTWTLRARRALLHEYGHAWLHGHLDEATRQEFLTAEGLTWADHDQPAELRGTERAADALAYGLIDELSPLWFSSGVSCEHYLELFRMLTDAEPLSSCPS